MGDHSWVWGEKTCEQTAFPLLFVKVPHTCLTSLAQRTVGSGGDAFESGGAGGANTANVPLPRATDDAERRDHEDHEEQ